MIIFFALLKILLACHKPSIISLSVQGRGVVHFEEKSDEIFVLNFGWIERNVQNFSMAGSSRANFFPGICFTKKKMSISSTQKFFFVDVDLPPCLYVTWSFPSFPVVPPMYPTAMSINPSLKFFLKNFSVPLDVAESKQIQEAKKKRETQLFFFFDLFWCFCSFVLGRVFFLREKASFWKWNSYQKHPAPKVAFSCAIFLISDWFWSRVLAKKWFVWIDFVFKLSSLLLYPSLGAETMCFDECDKSCRWNWLERDSSICVFSRINNNK